MANAKRTCNLILGVGDGKLPAFRSVQYSGSNIRFFDDKNMQPVYDWHPRMDNVVYYGMDWLCPGYTKVLSEQLTLHHGNITAENAISDIVAYTQTGNLGTLQPNTQHAPSPSCPASIFFDLSEQLLRFTT
jgi:isopenicillin-N N-acyltransferase-like protein